VLEDRVFGKPTDAADAHAMLTTLCGRPHDVLTAVVLVNARREFHAINRNVVHFAAQSPEQIARYVATGEPLGRAGAYATQGRASFFTERLEGSHTGVMGLPAFETARLLTEAGVRPDW
jgi:septum formation protein